MAAGTALAIAGGLASAGGAVAKMVEGNQQMQEAKGAMNEFEYPELENAYSDIQIPTTGAELKREEAQRSMAQSTEALEAGGVRGVVGGASSVQRTHDESMGQIAARMEEMEMQVDQQFAQEEARMRKIREQRAQQELSGIQQQYATGQQNKYSGLGEIGSSLMNTGLGLEEIGAEPFSDLFGGGEGGDTDPTLDSDFDVNVPDAYQEQKEGTDYYQNTNEGFA